MVKYVYLIQSLENSYYKIGVSKHPSKRICEIQTGNPCKIKLIDVYLSKYANVIEKTLHRRYSHLKKEGEWYYLSIGDEISFKKNCIQIEENLNVIETHGNMLL